MDRKDRERELVSALLPELVPSVISEDQVSLGFTRLLAGADDLSLDIPEAGRLLGLFLGEHCPWQPALLGPATARGTQEGEPGELALALAGHPCWPRVRPPVRLYACNICLREQMFSRESTCACALMFLCTQGREHVPPAGRAVVDEVVPPRFLAEAVPQLDPDSLGLAVVQETGTLLSARHAAERFDACWHGGLATVEALRGQMDALLKEYLLSGDFG
jgi:hypothetical protein